MGEILRTLQRLHLDRFFTPTGITDIHKRLNEFEFRSDYTTDIYGVIVGIVFMINSDFSQLFLNTQSYLNLNLEN